MIKGKWLFGEIVSKISKKKTPVEWNKSNHLIKEVMTNKEILAIYKVAEKHWSRPVWLCKILGWNNTTHGLCFYFNRMHSNYFRSRYFSTPWLPYRTKYADPYNYHFHTRKERLQAIRNVIKDLENEQ